MFNRNSLKREIGVAKGLVSQAQSTVERTCFKVDDVTAEKLCDPAFVDQETVRDTIVAQLCRYHLHGRAYNICLLYPRTGNLSTKTSEQL
ncbi:hypothetical protein TNCV_1334041 [Trichonephila clavipes]|nr:hypothetical protein TNCV_1334041 [Trichonephila clavipes]